MNESNSAPETGPGCPSLNSFTFFTLFIAVSSIVSKADAAPN